MEKVPLIDAKPTSKQPTDWRPSLNVYPHAKRGGRAAKPALPGVEIFLIAAFTFLVRCFGAANYGMFVAALSALIVFLIGINGVAAGPEMVARGA
jgi:hypothetical protein